MRKGGNKGNAFGAPEDGDQEIPSLAYKIWKNLGGRNSAVSARPNCQCIARFEPHGNKRGENVFSFHNRRVVDKFRMAVAKFNLDGPRRLVAAKWTTI